MLIFDLMYHHHMHISANCVLRYRILRRLKNAPHYRRKIRMPAGSDACKRNSALIPARRFIISARPRDILAQRRRRRRRRRD